ncbi:hypothetical protein CGRA01v4_12891 [Colletotrichum graminicola]|uniref:Uncharacterized protein n=1 Tax=Colletotrichum graminicola (strain M1.001 / M2 / FGSC 10212) TaxID=645133 RepID=E3QIZ0_COLGM|nr:uncharacterized protein GLRG_05972 [Colletotrichum graminicola M1.001]EFQ30828.1 hypothetical protein GLRG_05972 [Colletotrichum graminicola M1.001]WDK21601.1 hypothetical protein CGRA01v4_12891 [Colletotrichum graminicola]
MTPNSSSFRPSLHPIAESPTAASISPREKDATDRDARHLVSNNALSRRPRPDRPPPPPAPSRRLPSKRHAAPLELFRLMMPDVPTSPRPEADQPATASLSSSLQHQKAPLGSSPGAAAPSATAPDPAPDADPDADTAAAAEPGTEPAPKLDPAGFFTLVSNATTNSTHHPTVKYIFLDDDPDTLTAALAAHHAANQAAPTPSASTSKPAAPGGKNPPPSAVDRAVLLDVVPGADGQWTVASAASLSADFAVTDASIARQEGEKEGGLVLKIEGVESEGAAGGDKDRDRAESLPSSSSAVARSGGEEYGPLLEDFERKMSVLRRVVKAGEGRAEKAREKKPASDDTGPKQETEE